MNKFFEFLEKSGKLPKEPSEEDSFDLESLLAEEPEEELLPEAEASPEDHAKDFSNALKMRALRARRGLK